MNIRITSKSLIVARAVRIDWKSRDQAFELAVIALEPAVQVLGLSMLELLRIVLHRLEQYGWGTIAHGIHEVAHAAGAAPGALYATVTWLVSVTGSGMLASCSALIVPLAELMTPAAH